MASPHFALNCSLALADVPLLQKAARARELGYDTVEFWWPFATGTPSADEQREFIESVRDAGVETALINFPGGGASVDDRGLLCVPGRHDDFRRAAEATVAIGRELGVTRYNPMVGNAFAPWGPDSEEFRTAVDNLVSVAPLVAEAGGTIVLEPLSGFEHAALKTVAQARELALAARTAGARNVAVLLDFFHAATNDDDYLRRGGLEAEFIGHVQIADAPGRGAPGSGALPLGEWLQAVHGLGYRGPIGLEAREAPTEPELRAALEQTRR